MTAAAGAYGESDAERFLDEDSRSERPTFERDRARIVHSAALRRLAAKTQVVGPSSHDFIRNRLTHTLEVAQVGRDLAASIGCDPDVVEAACLAHDLGHPPFGHNGESALAEAATGIGGFEGNAQTFRLLTRLEAKAIAPDGRSLGLNLTRAVLDASTKYPWPLDDSPQAEGRHGDGLPRDIRKFGVYADDREIFDWMRRGVRRGAVCVEAQVMDFADDVAYSVHDVEDGIVAGRVDLSRLALDRGLRAGVWTTVRDWYQPAYDDDLLDGAYERLRLIDSWPTTPYDGSRLELARLKNLTSRLIGRFCTGVREAVDKAALPTPLTRYAADVPIPDDVRAEIAVLKGIAAHFVMKADDRVVANTTQREILHDLVGALAKSNGWAMEPAFAADLAVAADDAGRLRVVIDQVASLTDVSAVETHRRLVGPA
ncbi:MAG TPA: deoxyguanosinetriphosphate triphosphohydrolase [Nocardioidaceae bacterium]|nr:deoxyguanosinetriphosphate triphosphohydrolase [Nocardioidaceae bacterium]